MKWFDEPSGYGFILPAEGGKDLYVRGSSIVGDERTALVEGEAVEFETRQGGMGPEAVDVRVGPSE